MFVFIKYASDVGESKICLCLLSMPQMLESPRLFVFIKYASDVGESKICLCLLSMPQMLESPRYVCVY